MSESLLSPNREVQLCVQANEAARLSRAEAENGDRPIIEVVCSDTYGTKRSEQGMRLDKDTGEIVLAIVDATVAPQNLVMDSWLIHRSRAIITEAMSLRPGKEELTPVISFRISEEGIACASLERAYTRRRVQDSNKNAERDLKYALARMGILDRSMRNEAIGYCEIALADLFMHDLAKRMDQANAADPSAAIIVNDFRFTAPLRSERDLVNLNLAAEHYGLYSCADLSRKSA